MAKPENDPVAEALAAKGESRGGFGQLRVITLYGHRPAVLEQIKVARRDKRMSWASIAETMTLADPGNPISAAAIQKWCRQEGIK
jgi:hypothetical protein